VKTPNRNPSPSSDSLERSILVPTPSSLSSGVRVVGGDDPVGSVDRSARQHGHGRALLAVPDARALATASTRGTRAPDHSTGFFRASPRLWLHGSRARRAARRSGTSPHGRAGPRCRAWTQDAMSSSATLSVSRVPRRSTCAPRVKSLGIANAATLKSWSSNSARRLPRERWTRASDTLICTARRICKPKTPLRRVCGSRVVPTTSDASHQTSRRTKRAAHCEEARTTSPPPFRKRAVFEQLVAEALASIPRRFRTDVGPGDSSSKMNRRATS